MKLHTTICCALTGAVAMGSIPVVLAGDSAAENNLSLEQTLATDQLTADEGYRRIRLIVPLPMDREFVLTRAWEESTGNFERLN